MQRLSKQVALDAGPKAIQKVNFTGNPDRAGNIIKEAKETILDLSYGTLRVL